EMNAKNIMFDERRAESEMYGLRTDFRTPGIEGVVNLMIERFVVMCMGVGRLKRDIRKEG
ncbi:MAG: hypothetical protein K8R17_11980, partial [Methanosarcinales archaeon]|nr:hypothetical protein [Methanosarcinales archaeon]